MIWYSYDEMDEWAITFSFNGMRFKETITVEGQVRYNQPAIKMIATKRLFPEWRPKGKWVKVKPNQFARTFSRNNSKVTRKITLKRLGSYAERMKKQRDQANA